MTEIVHIHITSQYPHTVLCGAVLTYAGSTSVSSHVYQNYKLYDPRYTICPSCLASELLPMLELAETEL